MGVDKAIACRDCDEVARLDKVPFPIGRWGGVDTEEWFNAPNYRFQTMKLIAFVAEHEGHNLAFLTEASRHQSEFFRRVGGDEYDIGRGFGDVRSECDYEGDDE